MWLNNNKLSVPGTYVYIYEYFMVTSWGTFRVCICAFKDTVVYTMYTVVPLLKDTHTKGHLSNKDRIIWQQVLWMP